MRGRFTGLSWPLLLLLLLLLPFSLVAQQLPVPLPIVPDCEGPAGDPAPGTAEWQLRDTENVYCASQRHFDKAAHPNLLLPVGSPLSPLGRPTDDAYREPSRHDGKRFRFDLASVTTPEGQVLAVELYRPCDTNGCELPDGLSAFDPPYPAVISVHGGASRKELHWWSSQPLAESGYLVVSFDDATAGTSPTAIQVEAIIDWLFATPDAPTPAGEHNPFWQELNRNRVGIAGHSAGGVLAGRMGQLDDRLSAIVSWDRAQSSPLPDDLPMRAPAMFQFADYNCQQVPVCQPEPYLEAPDPEGPGNKGEDFQRLSAAGIDTMQIAIRAATHLDWTPPLLATSRYGELVSLYYTLAWFDRYLRGVENSDVAVDAFRRLTGDTFDASADRHNISQGFWDPAMAIESADPLYGGNVPYALAGMPKANRLSFYYQSRCAFRSPQGGFNQSDDLRAEGCPAGNAGADFGSGSGGGGGALNGLMIFGFLLLSLSRRIRSKLKESGEPKTATSRHSQSWPFILKARTCAR